MTSSKTRQLLRIPGSNRGVRRKNIALAGAISGNFKGLALEFGRRAALSPGTLGMRPGGRAPLEWTLNNEIARGRFAARQYTFNSETAREGGDCSYEKVYALSDGTHPLTGKQGPGTFFWKGEVRRRLRGELESTSPRDTRSPCILQTPSCILQGRYRKTPSRILQTRKNPNISPREFLVARISSLLSGHELSIFRPPLKLRSPLLAGSTSPRKIVVSSL